MIGCAEGRVRFRKYVEGRVLKAQASGLNPLFLKESKVSAESYLAQSQHYPQVPQKSKLLCPIAFAVLDFFGFGLILWRSASDNGSHICVM